MHTDPIPETLQLTTSGDGERIDQFIAAAVPALSRTEVQRLIKAGEIRVSGEPVKPSYRLSAGEVIGITLPVVEERSVQAEDIPLDILYENDDLAAVNKPAGMVVHPAQGNDSGTLVNAALARWPQMRRITGEERAGIVHRLDKDTSGVIVLAKTSEALKNLQAQFKARTTYKRYVALVEGVPASLVGIIEAPIGRDPKQRKRMAVIKGGRPATTRYSVQEEFTEHSLLDVEILTGRTHQIRVHLTWLGYPIAGDTVYGFRRRTIPLKDRIFLHAAELQVDSPSTGERLTFEAPLPPALLHVLEHLRAASQGAWS
jgi:23S rRNA pseudouridine1911/1915/1917 synthase